MPQPVDLYAWRNAIMSELGPANPLARSVLMAVSLHMKSDGTGAWLSQKLLATRTCVGERSVRRHLEIAERHGWIERARVRRDGGRAWYRTEYAACLPDAVYEQLPERPWEADPEWRRQAATVAGTPSASTVQTPDSRPAITQQPAPQARQQANGARVPANPDTEYRPELGRLTLPLNSSLNSSKNSSQEGALTRTVSAKIGFETKTKIGEAQDSKAVPIGTTSFTKRLLEPRGSARKESPEDARQRMERVVAAFCGKEAFANYGVIDLAKFAHVSASEMVAYLNSAGIKPPEGAS